MKNNRINKIAVGIYGAFIIPMVVGIGTEVVIKSCEGIGKVIKKAHSNKDKKVQEKGERVVLCGQEYYVKIVEEA